MRFIFALLLVTSSAAAEPYRPYAASPGRAPARALIVEAGYVGGGVGLTYDHFFNAFLDVQGGIRLPSLPLFARASLAVGNAGDFAGSGDFKQARIGLEGRTCTSAAVCWFAGVDVGLQRQTWSDEDEMTEHHEGWLTGGRAGLDAGGANLRFRLSLELYRYARSSDVASLPDAATSGGGLTLAIVHRL